MSHTEVQLDTFKWVDYLNPEQEMLARLADELGLERKILYNCLDSDYLPHIETYGGVQFLVLRLMEPESKVNADSVQELTTKIALFIAPEIIITIHRLPLNEVSAVQKRIRESAPEPVTRQQLIGYFYDQVAFGFDRPLTDLELKLENFEEKLFNRRKPRSFLREGFYLKRKASAFKKVLKLSLDLMNKLIAKVECSPVHFQEAKDRLERSLFYAEDVHENIQSLLNLHMAIEAQKTNDASFRTNEIMRVLTVLSIFFLPLNFLAGVFGMNFEHIPLLKHEMGFWITILVMLAISVALLTYLLKQGWMARPELQPPEENGQSRG